VTNDRYLIHLFTVTLMNKKKKNSVALSPQANYTSGIKRANGTVIFQKVSGRPIQRFNPFAIALTNMTDSPHHAVHSSLRS
jgi:hypothetical protein